MKVVNNELTCVFDIDDTLVMWGYPQDIRAIDIPCCYTGESQMLVPHERHIKFLKEQKERGYHVTVWSHSGWLWAKTVIEALKLEEYVDEVRTKFNKYVDDLQASEILGNRVYFEFKEPLTYYVPYGTSILGDEYRNHLDVKL